MTPSARSKTPRPRPRVRVSRHAVRLALERDILRGRYRPEQQLRQIELADRFGVAQAVVREALIELEHSGLVTSIDNRGVFVNDLGPDLVLEALELRERVEGLVAARCCRRITGAQVEVLEDLAHEIARLRRAHRIQECKLADDAWHKRLMAIAGSRTIARVADQFHVVGKLFSQELGEHLRRRGRRLSRPAGQVLAEHLAILHAIRGGDPDLAEDLMRRHIRHGRLPLERFIREQGLTSKWNLEEQASDA